MKITESDVLQKFFYDKLEIPKEKLSKIHEVQASFFSEMNQMYKNVHLKNPNAPEESRDYLVEYKNSKTLAKTYFDKINEITDDKLLSYQLTAAVIGNFSRYSRANYGIQEVVPMVALSDIVPEDDLQIKNYENFEAIFAVKSEVKKLEEPPSLKQYADFVSRILEAKAYNLPRAIDIINQQLAEKIPKPVINHINRFQSALNKYELDRN